VATKNAILFFLFSFFFFFLLIPKDEPFSFNTFDSRAKKNLSNPELKNQEISE